MLLQAITIDDRAYRVEQRLAELHPHAHLPQRLPAVAGGDRALRRAPHRPAHGAPGGPHSHYAETLRRWRENFERTPERLERARLRRALPAAVAAVPLLLRGRLRRAPDRARAGAARQAALGGGRVCSGSAGRRGAPAGRRRSAPRPRRPPARARRRAGRASAAPRPATARSWCRTRAGSSASTRCRCDGAARARARARAPRPRPTAGAGCRPAPRPAARARPSAGRPIDVV